MALREGTLKVSEPLGWLTAQAGVMSAASRASTLTLEHILDHLDRQRGELLAVLGSAAGGDARTRFGEQLRTDIRDYFDRLSIGPDRAPAERDAAATFVGHGLAAAIVAWLTGEIEAPRQELVPILVGLVPDWVNGTPPRDRGHTQP